MSTNQHIETHDEYQATVPSHTFVPSYSEKGKERATASTSDLLDSYPPKAEQETNPALWLRTIRSKQNPDKQHSCLPGAGVTLIQSRFKYHTPFLDLTSIT